MPLRHAMTARQKPGADPVLVFLHGLLESPALWAPLTRAAGESGWNWIAPPLPGHRADADRLPEAAALLADDAALADALADRIAARAAGRPVRLIGHSLGGHLALRIAAARPEMVRDALIVAPLHSGHLGQRATLRKRLVTEAPLVGPLSARVMLRVWLSDPPRFAAGLRSSIAPGEALADLPLEMRRDLRAGCPDTIRALAVWTRRQHACDAVARVRAPVTSVICTRDPVVAARHQMAVLRLLPDSVAQVIGTGHLPMLTQPDRFARLFTAWLDQAAPDAPRHGADGLAVSPRAVA